MYIFYIVGNPMKNQFPNVGFLAKQILGVPPFQFDTCKFNVASVLQPSTPTHRESRFNNHGIKN